MSVDPQVQNNEEIRVDTSESNLVQQRKHYEKQLEQERQARLAAEERLQAAERQTQAKRFPGDDDDEDDEPYVDHKKLKKKLSKFGEETKQETATIVQQEVKKALEQERQQNWLKNNPDFYDVMQHAQKIQDRDPELAETILAMPDTFERQKLVYKNIKALGFHKKEEPKSSVQDKINQNQRNPYYIPSAVPTPPYGAVAGGRDYNESDKKNAYEKMKQLQGQLRL